MNHPFAAEYEVRQRQQELRALAEAFHATRRARASTSGAGVDRLRHRLAQGLMTLGVTVGLPPERRRPAVKDAMALLERDGCLT